MSPVIRYELVNQFWRTVVFRHDTVPSSIHATVNNQEIVITKESIRRVLRFDDDAHDRVEFGYVLLQGCFRRMGYQGNLNEDKFNKKIIPLIWRFLAHVIIVCFSTPKGGDDSGNQVVQSTIVALVLNKRYNFMRYIFNAMKSNIANGTQRFIMFPRYIQLFLNDQVPNLPQAGRIIKPRDMLKRVFADCRNYSGGEAIPATPLFQPCAQCQLCRAFTGQLELS